MTAQPATITEVEDAADGYCRAHPPTEFRIELVTATDCAWSAEIKLIFAPDNPDGADMALTAYATGGRTADQAAAAAWATLADWADTLETLHP